MQDHMINQRDSIIVSPLSAHSQRQWNRILSQL